MVLRQTNGSATEISLKSLLSDAQAYADLKVSQSASDLTSTLTNAIIASANTAKTYSDDSVAATATSLTTLINDKGMALALPYLCA